MAFHIGTAGWTIPRQVADAFPANGSGLERYASRFNVAEINSSFHRPHRASTWERWRDSVPDAFRFSAKLPKTVTHVRKLVDCAPELDEFLGQAHLLGEKLAVLLVQLPPKLELDCPAASRFFGELASRTNATIACEPRNASWFSDEAEQLLRDLRVGRVGADPAVCEAASRPGGWPGIRYRRLHGSPVIYRSSYGGRIHDIAGAMKADQPAGTDSWCIFDNTASSAAAADALALARALS